MSASQASSPLKVMTSYMTPIFTNHICTVSAYSDIHVSKLEVLVGGAVGVVTLARLSGRPIVPVAIASSRYRSLATPNRYTINLPFSRIGMVVGDPIFVPRDAKAEELERWRQRVEGALNDVTRQAYAQVGADMANAAIRS